MEQLTQIVFYIGILTLGVNVITEVLKKIFVLKDGSHAGELISAVVSLVLTVLSVLIYCNLNSISISFIIVAGSVILSFFVCFSAMFGFDKLKELIEKYTK